MLKLTINLGNNQTLKNKMELKFKKTNVDYILESEPNWGLIIFSENNRNIVEMNGNILKFLEWLSSNKEYILKNQFFYGNPPDSLSKRIYLARELDFYYTEINEDEIVDYWHDKIHQYYKSHGVVFGLRGEKVKPYIIGLNGEHGEISLYDPDNNIDFSYKFDLNIFFENISKFNP